MSPSQSCRRGGGAAGTPSLCRQVRAELLLAKDLIPKERDQPRGSFCRFFRTLFANNKDSEFTLEDFNHWLGMYRDAAALGEAILVKLA